jgi:hypothetical protein
MPVVQECLAQINVRVVHHPASAKSDEWAVGF